MKVIIHYAKLLILDASALEGSCHFSMAPLGSKNEGIYTNYNMLY